MNDARNDLLLRAARRERTERTPVWLMRQAGRTDPDYRKLRARVDLPLEALFRDPDLAAEISLLPKPLGVDGIIIFQDILTPLAPMGAPFGFRPGPILNAPIRTGGDVDRLRPIDAATDLDFVAATLRRVQDALHGELPVLGFAGAPWTLAAFLIEGKSPSPDAPHLRAMMGDAPETLHRLLDKLASMTADYLAFQIEAGADAVQLFESFPDLLTYEQYREFAHPYQARVFSRLAGLAPTILFVKDKPWLEMMVESGADVLSVGRGVDLATAIARFGDRVAFQGNVDNRLLVSGPLEAIDRAVEECVAAGGRRGHILNLSHGLLKETPIENVRRFVDTARACGPAASDRSSEPAAAG